MCDGNNKHYAVVEVTHTAHGRQTQKHKGRVSCYVRARRAARALHDTRHSHKQRKTRREEKRREETKRKERRVVLDGGGARLADAATRHRLTQTNNKQKEKRTTMSRTSTREHKQFRKQVLARAQQIGITHCPACGVKLQYNNNGQRKPNSAEADHIIPASLGGSNHPDNGRILCAKCNSRRGNGKHGKGRVRHYQKNEDERDRLPVAVMPTQHSNTW